MTRQIWETEQLQTDFGVCNLVGDEDKMQNGIRCNGHTVCVSCATAECGRKGGSMAQEMRPRNDRSSSGFLVLLVLRTVLFCSIMFCSGCFFPRENNLVHICQISRHAKMKERSTENQAGQTSTCKERYKAAGAETVQCSTVQQSEVQ